MESSVLKLNLGKARKDKIKEDERKKNERIKEKLSEYLELGSLQNEEREMEDEKKKGKRRANYEEDSGDEDGDGPRKQKDKTEMYFDYRKVRENGFIKPDGIPGSYQDKEEPFGLDWYNWISDAFKEVANYELTIFLSMVSHYSNSPLESLAKGDMGYVNDMKKVTDLLGSEYAQQKVKEGKERMAKVPHIESESRASAGDIRPGSSSGNVNVDNLFKLRSEADEIKIIQGLPEHDREKAFDKEYKKGLSERKPNLDVLGKLPIGVTSEIVDGLETLNDAAKKGRMGVLLWAMKNNQLSSIVMEVVRNVFPEGLDKVSSIITSPMFTGTFKFEPLLIGGCQECIQMMLEMMQNLPGGSKGMERYLKTEDLIDYYTKEFATMVGCKLFTISIAITSMVRGHMVQERSNMVTKYGLTIVMDLVATDRINRKLKDRDLYPVRISETDISVENMSQRRHEIRSRARGYRESNISNWGYPFKPRESKISRFVNKPINYFEQNHD